ncbi:glycosyltransferase family 4 protein [soil metagenome]
MRILLLNQCFYPDHVSTAQHLTDLALGLVEAGHEVIAVASSRGYDNPETRYPVRDTWQGVTIYRIWTPGLGKTSKWRRLVDFAIFWFNATRILLRLPAFDVTVCLTSPPLISSLGTLMAMLKGGAVLPWVMDLNPDEAVAARWLKKDSFVEQALSTLQTWSFNRAARIVALDKFMARRIEAKGVPHEIIHVDAPWSHEDAVHYDIEARTAFRNEHGINGKFVVMYSGNHSPCHPVDTLLDAAKRLAANNRIHFMFVGGGSEFAKVKAFKAAHDLANVSCLPYQPLAKLSGSLSAADLHIVIMGPPFVGIVHPCKIYNILSLGSPFLCICPTECHLTELVTRVTDKRYAMTVQHGEVDNLVKLLLLRSKEGGHAPSIELSALGAQFSRAMLSPRFVRLIEECSLPA